MRSERSETRRLPLQLGKGAHASEFAGLVMELTDSVSEKLCKVAKGISKKGNSGPEKFAEMVQKELAPELSELWRECILWTAETSTAFMDGGKMWEETIKRPEFPKPEPLVDASARAIAKKYARVVLMELVDLWAQRVLGRKWAEAQEMAQTEGQLALLAKKIRGTPGEVRAQTLAHIMAHASLYGQPESEARRQVVARSLVQQVDKALILAAPGVATMAGLLGKSKEAVADAMFEAAEKVELASQGSGKKEREHKPAGPTEKKEEGAAHHKSGNKGQLRCFSCNKQGHMRRDCPEAAIRQCFNCGEAGHGPRHCPESTCTSCGASGHMRVDCNKEETPTTFAKGPKAEPNKGEAGSKCSWVEEEHAVASNAAVAPVLVVHGTLDGKEAAIGLDSFAGIGMVTAAAVADRRDEWEPTSVRLQGVAKEAVKPLGEIEVHIKLGEGSGFVERAAICEHLPAAVDMLVSHDTLKEQGLVLGKNQVLVGGEKCTVAHRSGASGWAYQHGAVEAVGAGSANHALKQAKKMLRQQDPWFGELESRGLIEEVVVENDGSCGGYRVRWADEHVQREDVVSEMAHDQGKRRKRRSEKKGQKAEQMAKKEKHRARRWSKQREWESVREEIEALAEQNEALRVAGAVMAQKWARVSLEQVQEVVTTAPTVRAVRVIEDNAKAANWEKMQSQQFLGTEEDVTEVVDPDEYCVPKMQSEEERKEWLKDYEKAVDELAAKSALQSDMSRKRYKEIMMRHCDAYCFSLHDFEPGQLDVPELRLNVKDGPPIVDTRRQMGVDDEEWYRERAVLFDKVGLWEPPTQEMYDKGLFVSNPVIVKAINKKTLELERRITVDYWGPNSRIESPPQRIPVVAELADRLHDAVLFDKDDGISGYYQWKLHKDSKRFTGVYTPLGVRVFNCMPLGINVAPSAWNGAMAGRFGDMPGNRFFALMDDFLRFTPKAGHESRQGLENDHLDLLEEFLTRVRKARLKLKLPKAAHAVEKVEALGMEYGKGYVAKTEWTSRAIRDYPVPTSAKKMERFLALGQYYAQFVESYARLVAPLRKFQRKRHWAKGEMSEGSPERALFEKVREELLTKLKLTVPDWSKEFITKSDWSEEAIGGALLQRGEDGILHPVAFISRKCTPAEAKLAAPDGEMVALVWTIKRFEKYLMGRKFTAYVDQGSLSWLKDKALSSINNKRLQGAFAYLRQFQFDLMYKKSKEMGDVDALSRAVAATVERSNSVVVEVELDSSTVAAATEGVAQVDLEGYWGFDTVLKDIGELQQTDDEVLAIRQLMGGKKALGDIEVVPSARAVIAQYLAIDPKCEQFVEGGDGRLYHLELQKGEWVRQLYVPLPLRGRLVVTKHASAAGGHRAAAEILAKMRKQYYWMSMKRDIEAMIASCGCQRKKGEKKQRVGVMQSLKIMRPGEKVIFDIFGPLPVSLKGNAYLLVLVDVGTREIMLEALPSRMADGVAKVIFERIYLRGMAPRLFQSDQAKEFVAAVMKELLSLLGAEFRHSSPYHPQTNTHVERYNKTIATNLSLLLKRQDQRDWDEYLRFVEYAQLVGAQQVLGRMSPLFLKGGWEALDPTDRAMGTDVARTKSKAVGQWMEDLQKARQIAMQSQESAVAREAKRMNLKVKDLNVDVNDRVWVMFPNVGTGKSRKLAFRMHGTYVVKKWLYDGKRVALLGHEKDEKDEIVVHVDRMVKKRELPKHLRELWRPIRVESTVQQNVVKKVGKKKARAQQEKTAPERSKVQVRKEKAKIAEAVKHLDKETAKELEKELEDEDYRIEKILDHEEGKNGSRQYKVRFVGYGPKNDLWYEEHDLMETASEMVADYEEMLEGRMRVRMQQRRPEGAKRAKKQRAPAEKGQ